MSEKGKYIDVSASSVCGITYIVKNDAIHMAGRPLESITRPAVCVTRLAVWIWIWIISANLLTYISAVECARLRA